MKQEPIQKNCCGKCYSKDSLPALPHDVCKNINCRCHTPTPIEDWRKDVPKTYEEIIPLVDRMKAKYPKELNMEGLEPALTNDIAEIVAQLREKDRTSLIESLVGEIEAGKEIDCEFFHSGEGMSWTPCGLCGQRRDNPPPERRREYNAAKDEDITILKSHLK